MQHIGKFLVIAGLIVAVMGGVLWLGGDRLGWLGKLPGDIRISRPGFGFYFPITTMILVSVILSLAAWLIGRLFGDL